MTTPEPSRSKARLPWQILHHRAQQVSIRASQVLASGKRDEARRLFAEAAAFECESLATIATDKPKTRAIVGVSYASLLLKAEAYARAEQAVCGLLARADLEPFATRELRLMLEAIWEEEALQASGVRYSGEELQVSLRGGRIGSGTAPADTALHYLGGFNSLCYRASEWACGKAFRTSGPPPQEVADLLQSRATQPASGSYRFSIRLVQPRQMSLLPDPRERAPQRAAEAVVGLVRAIIDDDAKRAEETVPDPKYRLVMMKLARNILPSGGSLDEVEIRRMGEHPVNALVLRAGARPRFTEAIRVVTLDREEARGHDIEVEGTLRALDLDKRWLAIDKPDGERMPMKLRPEAALDDVLGPMVNKPVIAYATEIGRPPGARSSVLLRDIELRDTSE